MKHDGKILKYTDNFDSDIAYLWLRYDRNCL